MGLLGYVVVSEGVLGIGMFVLGEGYCVMAWCGFDFLDACGSVGMAEVYELALGKTV